MVVVFGLWFVVCGLLCVVLFCVLGYLVFGVVVWFAVCGLVCGLRFVVFCLVRFTLV